MQTAQQVVSAKPYTVDPETGCWVWSRSVTGKGYAQTFVGGKNQGAHRVFYEHFRGPIPAGLHIDHLCRVRACVNPDHLEAVTVTENTRRGSWARLTREDVGHIRSLARAVPQVVLAAWYGVSPRQISTVIARQSWVDA